jgi:hypothetical protein
MTKPLPALPRSFRTSDLVDWTLWQTFIKKGILGRGRHLKRPLGEWNHMADNPWHYCRHEDAIYHISKAGSFRFSRIPRHSGKPRFS